MFHLPTDYYQLFCGRSASFSLPQYKTMSTSTSHHRYFPNPWQWVWCVNIETVSTRTQTIPDASKKDATSRNQTHAPEKRRGRMPCAHSLGG